MELPKKLNVISLKFQDSGFTLVELLITVAILAILAAVGVTVFSNVQRDSRDVARKQDINSIAKALEVYNSSNKKYGTLSDSGFASGKIPADPSGSTNRKYCIAYGTGSTPLPTPNASWTTSCPTTPVTYYEITTSTPVDASTVWRACTYLETNSVFCRTNQQ